MAVGHIKVRTLKDGSRRYQARIPSPGNRRKDVVKTFMRKGDAERWLAAQATAMVTGDFISPAVANRPFARLVEVWERTRAAGLAPKTRERYASITRTHLLPAFGSTPVSRLDRSTIKAYFAECGLHPATARKVQTTLSSILSEGVELGWLRENPAARLRLPTPPRRDMTILTAVEVRSLANTPARPADRLAILTAAYTGLRAGELWALQARDVLDDPPRLLVQRTLTSESGHLVFRNTTKTGRSRVVSLPAFLANMLQAHLGDQKLNPDELLFTSPDGAPTRHELFVRRVFRPAVGTALPADKQTIRFHDLRHTCASLLIDAGANILLVSKRLGHAKPSMTMDVYGWMYPSAEEALADALEATWEQDTVIDLDAHREDNAA